MHHVKKNPILLLCVILVGLGLGVSLTFWILTDHWRRRVKPPDVGHGDRRVVIVSGDVPAGPHTPEQLQQLESYHRERTRFQRLHRMSFGGIILSIFLFSIIAVLADWRENKRRAPENREPQPSTGCKVFGYRSSFYDHGMALLVALLLLIFWCVTMAIALEDGLALEFVVKLNLAFDFFLICATVMAWYVDQRLNTIQVSVTQAGVRYQNDKGVVTIDYPSIQEVTFSKFFLPGWIRIVSRSKTISFATGFGMDGDLFQALKTALPQNHLGGRYDEAKLLDLCNQARADDAAKENDHAVYAWSLALGSLLALSGFAFIPDSGILLIWCSLVIGMPSFVFVWIQLWRRDNTRKQMVQNDSPVKAPATFKQDLKLLVVIGLLTYLGAVAAVLLI